MRAIDADALMERLNRKKAGPANQRYTEGFNDCLMRVRSMVHSAPTLTPQNESLTIKQLREMDGEPVWVEFEDGSGGLWGIVHITIFEQIVFANGLHCTIGERYYGKSYKAYRRPPERQEDT